jgi:hypothetical protein
MGGATPGYEMGGMTPYGGSRTPSHRGEHNGGADMWSAQTPAHRQEEREADEVDEDEEWRRNMQEAADVRTPGGALNPVTPGGGVPPQTPRTPYVPTTPYEPATPHGASAAAAAAGAEDVDMEAAAVPQTPATPYDPQAMAEAAAADAAQQAAEEEAAAAAAAAAAVPAGLFTSQATLGCHVLLSDSGDQVFVIVSIDDEYRVHVRPLSAKSSAATRVVDSQSDLRPVHPTEKSASKEAVVLTGPVPSSSSGKLLPTGERVKLTSFMGDQVLIARRFNDPGVVEPDADVLHQNQMEHLCVAEPLPTSGEEEEQAAAASAKSKKKGSRKR